MKITITRALSELKLLDSRIKDGIRKNTFIDVYQKRLDRALYTKKTKSEYEKEIKAEYKSIIDLIERRQKIKSAIILSNSNTIVKINNESMTVVEAIDKKTSIEYERILLENLRASLNRAKNDIEINTTDINNKIENMISQSLGSDKKTNKEDYDNIAKPFLEANILNVIDPINIEDKINFLSEKVDAFLTEVDFVLSESNAKTKIEI